ncbi:MAG TPA: hypothetical protein EYO59_04630 [Chromatiaceae bacterium]|nr:hypothetical protein [Chromatiaceae bacterium]
MEDSYLDSYWEDKFDIQPSYEQHEDYNAYEEQQIFEDHEDRADSKWEYSLLKYDEPDSEDDNPFLESIE